MAQEDNVLNARMAIASSRDSSSMKALAVITAIFLPGEFLGTLFGMSMFDWMADKEPGPDRVRVGGADDDEQVMSHKFWIYWLVAIPLTFVILCVWRGWWVTEDRFFRRHLSRELSEERYWTADGKPRRLEKSFVYDFFRLSARWDENADAKSSRDRQKGLVESTRRRVVNKVEGLSETVDFGPTERDADSIRYLRALFARRKSVLWRRPSETV
jgi:hypothetical protein